MASHTIFNQQWADGTTVEVFPAASWPDPSRAPAATAVTDGVVASGSVEFVGLEEQVRYVAYAAGKGVTFVVPQLDGSPAGLRQRLDRLEGDTLPSVGSSIANEESAVSTVETAGNVYVTGRLKNRDVYSIRDHPAGKATSVADNTDAFAEVAAEPNMPPIHVPDPGNGDHYNIDGFVELQTPGQTWYGDGDGSKIRAVQWAKLPVLVTADDVTFGTLGRHMLLGNDPDDLGARPSWSFSGASSGAIDTAVNQDSSISRSALVYAMGQRFKFDIACEDVYSALRIRPLDRYTTDPAEALWGIEGRLRAKRFQMGCLPMGMIAPRIHVVGQDTHAIDTAPPHILYLAGTGLIPEGIVVPGKAVTGVAATDLFTSAGNHGLSAGSYVAFDDDIVGGTGIVPFAVYTVSATGLTATEFKLDGLNITTDLTSGTFYSPADLDADGDSDLPIGAADFPVIGGVFTGIDYNNAFNASFKMRNMRGGKVDFLSIASARVLEASWNQGTKFRIKGEDMRQTTSESGEPSLSSSQTFAQGTYNSFCEFDVDLEGGAFPSLEDPEVTDYAGEHAHGITLRSCIHCPIKGRSSLRYASGSASTRRHIKIVGGSHIDIDPEFTAVNLGADRPIMDVFEPAHHVTMDRPTIIPANPDTPFVLVGFDDDTHDNAAIFAEAKIKGAVDGATLKSDNGVRNRATLLRDDIPSVERLWRGAHVETFPRYLAGVATNVAMAGAARGILAVVRRSDTYSKFKLTTGGTITSVTELRLAVWDEAKALIAETGNVSATVTATSTGYEVDLLTPIALEAGQLVYLGVCFAGTAFHVRGLVTTNHDTTAFDGGPYLAGTAAWTTGTPPTLGNYTGGQRPYFALVA